MLAYKFKCDFTMCADNTDARDTTINQGVLAREPEKRDADGDVQEECHGAATLHEGRFKRL